jgi:hypothetical protein
VFVSQCKPRVLYHFQNISLSCLQVIIALNAARSNALTAIRDACGHDLHEALRDACTVLAHVPSSRDLSASERSAHLASCQCLLETLAPLVTKLFLQVCSCLCSSSFLQLTDADCMQQELSSFHHVACDSYATR